MLSEKLKDTLRRPAKIEILKAMVAIMGNCAKLFLEFGISPATISFIEEGMHRIAQEFKEGADWIEFNQIISPIDDKKEGEIK